MSAQGIVDLPSHSSGKLNDVISELPLLANHLSDSLQVPAWVDVVAVAFAA